MKPGQELTKSTYQFRTIAERAAVRFFAETADDESLAVQRKALGYQLFRDCRDGAD